MQNPESKKFSLVLFASGNGTNAVNIIDQAKNLNTYDVDRVFSNYKNAPIVKKAEDKNLAVTTFTKDEFYNTNSIKDELEKIDPDLIVLAGFMWIFPKFILDKFPGKVINIHPALLPKYGGKGMYGDKVHQAVLAKDEPKSGITIHYVNEHYDEGKVIAQYDVPIDKNENLSSLKDKIQKLEHRYYPLVIHQLLKQKNG